MGPTQGPRAGDSRRAFPYRSCVLAALLLGGFPQGGRAEAPPLLARAFEQWTSGVADLAFTQQTRFFLGDGRVKNTRTERYDPSLPDSRRWRLIEVDGRPASPAERDAWDSRKNGKPRRKIVKSPSEYLDLDHARLVGENATSARFEVGMRPEASRLLSLDKIGVVITVDKGSASIVLIAARLLEQMPVLLGLARITDLDVDVGVEPRDEDPARNPGGVTTGSTARMTISELGYPKEYSWSEFRRVASYGGP